MSQADIIFQNMCKDIIENGTSTEGEAVRPHWPDGTSAYTIKQFGVVNRYDLRKEFPILTLRRIALKSATDEILWIYQQKSNNIHDLHSHIWDEWADEDGSIGKAYGYQIAQKHKHLSYTREKAAELLAKKKLLGFEACENTDVVADQMLLEGLQSAFSEYPSAEIAVEGERFGIYLDQMDSVIWDLKNTPFSRRIMMNTYNHHDLPEMNLHPCAYSVTFNVTQRPGEDKLTLNAILNQRSNDLLAAGNWNVIQYAVLVHMLAQCVDMNVGEFVHVIADAHIYDRHVDAVKELLNREPLPAPVFHLNPEIHNFYQFTRNDVSLENYQYGEDIGNIEVAI